MQVIQSRVFVYNGINYQEDVYDTGEVKRRPLPLIDELPESEQVVLDTAMNVEYMAALMEIEMEG